MSMASSKVEAIAYINVISRHGVGGKKMDDKLGLENESVMGLEPQNTASPRGNLHYNMPHNNLGTDQCEHYYP
jgi:hypothetical protein